MAHHSKEHLLNRPVRAGRRQARKGAVIVLMAIFLVVMISLLALAIDLGYIFMLRTQVQSAVDVAAMAGAGALGDGQTAAEEARRAGRRPKMSPVPTERRKAKKSTPPSMPISTFIGMMVGGWTASRIRISQ